MSASRNARSKPLTLEVLEAEHELLSKRLHLLDEPVQGDEATALWTRLGVAEAAQIGDLDVDAVRALRTV